MSGNYSVNVPSVLEVYYYPQSSVAVAIRLRGKFSSSRNEPLVIDKIVVPSPDMDMSDYTTTRSPSPANLLWRHL